MKQYRAYSFLCLMVCMVCAFAYGQKAFIRNDGIGFYGHLNQNCIPHNGGTVYLQIGVSTPAIQNRERKPMNLAVVLDRSGSMAEARKIDYAKAAISSLIDRLSSDDYLSIVIYDNSIDVLAPRQPVRDRAYLKRLVNSIEPRGSTNLGGGMTEGFHQLGEHVDREFVNRVILLSDGLANQGITDPYELERIASDYRSRSISLSTMGVGLDYNENLMLGLAQHGGGNYYYIESPSQLAGMFERELHGLSTVVAQNASIELTLGDGVTFSDAIGCQWHQGGSTWNIPLGDLYSDEHREITVELNIPEGNGTRHVATGILNYDSRYRKLYSQPRFSVDIRYSDIASELDKGKDWDVQGKVDVALSTRKVEQAMQSLDAGNQEQAIQQMGEARSMISGSGALANSPAAAPMLNEQMMQLDSFTSELKDKNKSDAAKKKSIQYKNYKVQKKIE